MTLKSNSMIECIGHFLLFKFWLFALFVVVIFSRQVFAEPIEFNLKQYQTRDRIVAFEKTLLPDSVGIASQLTVNLRKFGKFPQTTVAERYFILENTLSSGKFNLYTEAVLRDGTYSPANVDGEFVDINSQITSRPKGSFGFQATGNAEIEFGKSEKKFQAVMRILSDLNVPRFQPLEESDTFCSSNDSFGNPLSRIRSTTEIALKLAPDLLADMSLLEKKRIELISNEIPWASSHFLGSEEKDRFKFVQHDPLLLFLANNCFMSVAKKAMEATFVVPKTDTYSTFDSMPIGMFIVDHLLSPQTWKLSFKVIDSEAGLKDAVLVLNQIDGYLAFLQSGKPRTSIDKVTLSFLHKAANDEQVNSSFEKRLQIVRGSFYRLRSEIVVKQIAGEIRLAALLDVESKLFTRKTDFIIVNRAATAGMLKSNFLPTVAPYLEAFVAAAKLPPETDFSSEENDAIIRDFASRLRSPFATIERSSNITNSIKDIARWITEVRAGNETLKSLADEDLKGSFYEFNRQSLLNDEAVEGIALNVKSYRSGFHRTTMGLVDLEDRSAIKPIIEFLVDACIAPSSNFCSRGLPEAVAGFEAFATQYPKPKDFEPAPAFVDGSFAAIEASIIPHFQAAYGEAAYIQKSEAIKEQIRSALIYLTRLFQESHEFRHSPGDNSKAKYAYNEDGLSLLLLQLRSAVRWAASRDAVPSNVSSMPDKISRKVACYYFDRNVAGPMFETPLIASILAFDNKLAPIEGNFKSDSLSVSYVDAPYSIGVNVALFDSNSPCTFAISHVNGKEFLAATTFILARKNLESVFSEASDQDNFSVELAELLKSAEYSFKCIISSTLIGTYQYPELMQCKSYFNQLRENWANQFKREMKTLSSRYTEDFLINWPNQTGNSMLKTAIPSQIRALGPERQSISGPVQSFAIRRILDIDADISNSIARFNHSVARAAVLFPQPDGTETCLVQQDGDSSLAVQAVTSYEQCIMYNATVTSDNATYHLRLQVAETLSDYLAQAVLIKPTSPLQRHVLRRYSAITERGLAESYNLSLNGLDDFVDEYGKASALKLVFEPMVVEK